MLIDQFNVQLDGGAAIAARRLHDGLRKAGVDSRFWYVSRAESAALDDSYQQVLWEKSGLKRFSKLASKLNFVGRRIALRTTKRYYLKGHRNKPEIFRVPRTVHKTPYRADLFQGDVLHLHWLSDDVDWPSFFGNVPPALPIVWTLHDMNPLTGGCDHADTCIAYTTECKACPLLTRPGPRDLANGNFHLKANAYRGKNLHLVTPSRWLENIARRSTLGSHAQSIQTIYNGLDLSDFSPIDKPIARRALGLASQGIVLAFGAESLDNHRKGFPQFLAALQRLPASLPLQGLLFGKGKPPTGMNGFPFRHVGYLTDTALRRLVYSAADIFVMPSHAENMPQTIVEAMACGTPTVAFDVGGIGEIVKPHETGLLVPLLDVEALAGRIEWLATHHDARISMGRAARLLVEREFDHKRQTVKYVAMYRTLVERQVEKRHAA